jgi:4-azaleucine resistance transporter AzlC
MKTNQATDTNHQHNIRQGFFSGVKLALPIVMGYVPVSFAFGVLAVNVGLTPLDALLMGLLYFAGSGQLMTVAMLGAGVGFLPIILSTAVVNLRHVLMSAAMASPLKRWPAWRKLIFAFQLTDETFALHAGRFSKMEKAASETGREADISLEAAASYNVAQTFGINITAHSSWISGGFLGALLGDRLGDISALGLDYALPAMFVALIAPRLLDRPQCLAALAGGVFSVAFVLLGEDQWNIMLGALIAATIGALLPDGRKPDAGNNTEERMKRA